MRYLLLVALLVVQANAMKFGWQGHRTKIEYRITWQVVDCPKCPVFVYEWCNWPDDLRNAKEGGE